MPDLGGRILRILDKRSNREVFGNSELKWHSGGARKAFIRDGISLFLGGGPRLNDAGPTDFMILPSDEEGEAGVWIGETSQEDLSFHLRVGLEPDTAEILLEARIFNRRLSATHYNGGLAFGGCRAAIWEGGSWGGTRLRRRVDRDVFGTGAREP